LILIYFKEYNYKNPEIKENKNQDPSYVSIYKRKENEVFGILHDKLTFETQEKGESD
jgi:hypothetical protein